jgi:hypothetical protein|nr:MAG TPA: hypothetical protein [Bacteriophage sp.]
MGQRTRIGRWRVYTRAAEKSNLYFGFFPSRGPSLSAELYQSVAYK